MEIFPYRGGQYRRNDRDNGPQGLVNIAGMAAFPLEKIHLQVVSIAGMGGQDDRRGWSGWIGIPRMPDLEAEHFFLFYEKKQWKSKGGNFLKSWKNIAWNWIKGVFSCEPWLFNKSIH